MSAKAKCRGYFKKLCAMLSLKELLVGVTEPAIPASNRTITKTKLRLPHLARRLVSANQLPMETHWFRRENPILRR